MKSLIALLLLAFVAVASAQTTIVQVLAQQSDLYSQLSASITGKPIEAFLNNATISATLFAPVNEKTTPVNLTNDGISYHTLDEKHPATFTNGELLVTLLTLPSLKDGRQRVKVSFADNVVKLGPNEVVLNQTAVDASNGVVFGLEKPLDLPADLATLTASTEVLKPFSTFLEAAEINLNDSVAAVTVFAPADTAFSAFKQAQPLVYSYLTSSDQLAVADLKSILNLHVATSVVYSNQFTTGPLATLNGGTIDVNATASPVTVGNALGTANIVTADNLASNGVAHIIDKVLVPTNFEFNLRKALIGLGLNKFLAAMDKVGLVKYLDNVTPFTLFAPTDAVIANSNITDVNFLLYHVVVGHLASLTPGVIQSELNLSTSANSAHQQLHVNTTTVNGYKVSAPQDLGATRGVIYMVDGLLAPPKKTLVEVAGDKFAKLASAVVLVGLANEVVDTTVFAPTDKAFTADPVGAYLLLNTSESRADLVNVLHYHLVGGKNMLYVGGTPALTSGVLPTLNGDVNVTVGTENNVTVNEVKVSVPNVLASNGVLHGVDAVLRPINFVVNTNKVLQGFKVNYFLSRLTQANLTHLLTGTEPFTIFAFTDAAYDSAPKDLTNNPSKWPNVIRTHIYNGTIDLPLVPGKNYTMLSGQVLNVVSATSVQVVGAASAGKPSVVGGPVSGLTNGVVVVIDGILSVKPEKKSDGGLSDNTIAFIVIGCIIGVLLIIGAAGGGYWYYKKRAGYESIGDNAF